MKRLHYLAIGIHLAGLILFAYVYALTGSTLAAIFAGWCCLYGALSVQAVRAKMQRRPRRGPGLGPGR